MTNTAHNSMGKKGVLINKYACMLVSMWATSSLSKPLAIKHALPQGRYARWDCKYLKSELVPSDHVIKNDISLLSINIFGYGNLWELRK